MSIHFPDCAGNNFVIAVGGCAQREGLARRILSTWPPLVSGWRIAAASGSAMPTIDSDYHDEDSNK